MKNALMVRSLVGAATLAAGGFGGYLLKAEADTGAVNQGAIAAPRVPAPSFADIVARVAPAVVSIDVEGRGKAIPAVSRGLPFMFGSPDQDGEPGLPFDQPDGGPQGQGEAPRMQGLASGFFISADGYIVTNNHVVDGADKITVTTKDGRELKARLIGADPATDLAVVKVDGGGFPYVDFEDRAKPRVGDWVVAVGNPFGLGGTATAGIVSALGRRNVAESGYVDYMQIDAPINRGNSGGPSFDLDGRVVGVNTAIYSPSGGSVGIGFDIPADVAASVTRQLIAGGKVVRGYIGATVQDLNADIADSLGLTSRNGALVAEVTPGGPSEQAGLRPGDLVLAVNGHAVDSSSDLTRQVGLAHPGEAIRLQVRRDGQTREISVRSGLRPSEAALAANDQGAAAPNPAGGGVLGMALAPNQGGGVSVLGVRGGSDASDKGLRRGDVILRAGQTETASPADLASAAAQARRSGHKDILLFVLHQGRHVFVPLKLDEAQG